MWPVVFAGLAAASAHGGFDEISKRLNEQIRREADCSDGGIYCGGKGILVRSPLDGFENDFSKLVVPATFWVNDIFTPTALYPGQGSNGNVMCPSDQGFCDADPNTGDDGPWNYAQLAIVVGSGMWDLMSDYDNIQSYDWGWGVFYPTDSNAVDKRCRYLESDGGYDCPGGWIDINSGSWQKDHMNGGSGAYPAGNPYTGGGGGGTGCHTDLSSRIDQNDAYTSSGTSLTRNYDCECNYEIVNDGDGSLDIWVDTFMSTWHGPMYSLDYAACWMNNPRDMIKLQNALWWKRTEWADGSVPWAEYGNGAVGIMDGDRRYWGWNEIPVDRFAVNDPLNWDAVMIKLPAAMSGSGDNDNLSMLDWGHSLALEEALNTFVFDNQFLIPGSDNIAKRPGSYVVVVREFVDDSLNFNRQFFCEDWMSPSQKFQIIYDQSNDCCYIEWGPGAKQVSV